MTTHLTITLDIADEHDVTEDELRELADEMTRDFAKEPGVTVSVTWSRS